MSNAKEVDISAEVGYEPAKVPDQITGKLFPNTRVKSGTRWFYVLLLLIVLGSIIFKTIAALAILFW